METKYFGSIFADLTYSIQEYAIQSKTEIWVFYQVTGIFKNAGWGFQPTAKPMEGNGVGIFTIEQDQIVDQKRIYSMYNIFVSCKAVPPFWELASFLNKVHLRKNNSIED